MRRLAPSPARLAAILLAAAAAPGARAVATTDACPAELPVRQTVVGEQPGWAVVNQQESYPFARIALFRGPPSDDQRLIPSSENRNATGLHDLWRLPHDPAGYWIACEYGNTTATLARKLDDDNDLCVADYDRRFTTLVVRHWICMPWRQPAHAAARAAAVPRRAGHGH